VPRIVQVGPHLALSLPHLTYRTTPNKKEGRQFERAGQPATSETGPTRLARLQQEINLGLEMRVSEVRKEGGSPTVVTGARLTEEEEESLTGWRA
jgi:hypothetical protein